MFRNASDVATYARSRGVQRTISLLNELQFSQPLSFSSFFQTTDGTVNVDALATIFNADDTHDLARYLFKNFAHLNIKNADLFTCLAQTNPAIASFLFQEHYKTILPLYYPRQGIDKEKLTKLAETHALNIMSLYLGAQSQLQYGYTRSDFPQPCMPSLEVLYDYVVGTLSDQKKFVALDQGTEDGTKLAEKHSADILAKINPLKLTNLKPQTLANILTNQHQTLLNIITTLSELVEIYKHIGRESFISWSRDELWQMNELLMKEEPSNAAASYISLLQVAPKSAQALLQRAPEDIVPLFDLTQFLNLLDLPAGVTIAIEMVKLRPEHIKALFTPFSNFVSLIQIDNRQTEGRTSWQFLDTFLANIDLTYRLASLIRHADNFMELVKADRFIAYQLLKAHPQIVLGLFKPHIVTPQTRTLSDKDLTANFKIIDDLIAKKAANSSAIVFDGSQSSTLFAGSESRGSAASGIAPKPSS